MSTARRDIRVRVVANRIRRGTTLSRYVLTELETLEPRLQAVMSQAVACGEFGFSGALPTTGAAAEEITSLLTELRAAGGVP